MKYYITKSNSKGKITKIIIGPFKDLDYAMEELDYRASPGVGVHKETEIPKQLLKKPFTKILED